ncbi:MAG: hypothetical protein AUI15_16280 [Actinobacteria bacterium 13_2_20CM_2_66_6]|nr:MAG: hypothetical protein AUI15_16280 [Actinobacteria bacterium 13_2_20CM_2_66_6]
MTTKTELVTLEASGLIQIAAVQPELEYLFRHALVQDAAYSSLLKQDRRALHELAAESLLTVYPDRQRELAAVIAMHFDQAGDVARAAEHYAIAGEHALERFAQREAVNFFKRAVELLPPDDPRVDLRMRAAIGAAKAGWTFSGLSGAIDLIESATEAAGDRADKRLLADAYFWIAFMRRVSGEAPESSPKLKHAVEQAEQIGLSLGDPAARAIPKAFMGAGVMFTGELREGAKLLNEALEALEGRTDALSTAILSGFLAMTYARLGQFDDAQRALARSERFAAQGDEIARLDNDIARTAIQLERGDIDDASRLGFLCAQTSETLGAVSCAVAANVLLGQSRLILEDVLGAGWNDALANAVSGGDRFGQAVTLWGRARTHLRRETPDWDAALADLDKALALFELMEARPSVARVLRDRGEVLRALGRTADADAMHLRSREIATELNLRDFS